MRRTRRTLAAAAAAVLLLSWFAATPPAGAAPSTAASRYIVTLSGTGPVGTALQNLVAAAGGGHVTRTFSVALHGGVVEVSPAAATALAALPGVALVEPDTLMSVSTTQSSPPSWGLDRIDQHTLPLSNSYSYTTTGAGVKAYIIDTGIRATHVDFGGRAIAGKNTVDSSPSTSDCVGHGTHVAGTVGGTAFGVAKSVTLVAVRVFGCSSSTPSSAIIAGIDWVITNHQAGQPAVANMSLGGAANASLDNAVRALINDGVTTVVAAGNDSTSACTESPSRVAEAITAGATDINDNRASFSNFGTCVDLHAPGVNIVSDYNTSNTATATLSGTSMATPHVTGAAARYLQSHTAAPPSEVQTALINNATVGVVKGIATTCSLLQSLLGTCTKGTPNRLLYVNPAS